MRFVDEAIINVRAGKGGNGCVSFRREKFVPRGGPDGGNGGDGASIYAKATNRLHSLYDFRLKRNYDAKNGSDGSGSQCDGKKAEDLILEFPVGTQLFERGEFEEVLVADLSDPEACILIAQGGRGGKGNEHFKSSTNRAPRFAQRGEEGENKSLRLELKILADAGLLGLPNAGKSTFLSQISAAKPKIADYPFTTLSPNLGVIIDEVDPDTRMIVADIPGLIEGAHLGLGLGDKFLKHIERTRFLIHILSAEDINKNENPFAGFELINDELYNFDEELADRLQIEVINKIDLITEEEIQEIDELAKKEGREIYFISAKNGIGLEPLIERMWELQSQLDINEPLVHYQDEEIIEDEEFPEIEVVYTREQS